MCQQAMILIAHPMFRAHWVWHEELYLFAGLVALQTCEKILFLE